MLSNKFLATINYLFALKKDADKLNDCFEQSQAVGALFMDFKENLNKDLNPNAMNLLENIALGHVSTDNIKKINNQAYINDYNNFVNNIYNGCLSTMSFNSFQIYNQNSLTQLDFMQMDNINLISSYCDAIQGSFDHKTCNNQRILQIYFCKLLMPIYFMWKNDMAKYFNYINHFDRLTNIPYLIKFNPAERFNQYYHKIKTQIFVSQSHKTIMIKLIDYLLQLHAMLPKNKEQLVTQYSQQTSVKSEKVNNRKGSTGTNTRTRNVRKSQSKSRGKSRGKSQGKGKSNVTIDNNISISMHDYIKKGSKIKELNIEFNVSNLDDYKVQGLKALCAKLNLPTNACRYRKDYINLLLPHCKQ